MMGGDEARTVTKRTRGRPRLSEGENPAQVNVRLPQEMLAGIDATGQKRSAFAREAIRRYLAEFSPSAS